MIAENPGFLLWMATTVGLCWILPRRALPFVLVATCGAYLAAYSPWSLLALAMVTACCGLTLINGKGRHGYVLASIAFSCALFIAYRAFRPSSGLNEDLALLGFAFYILRAIHILLESYSGRLKTPGWAELICWLWFLPTLQVGPIHRFQPFQRDLVRRRWDADLFANGLQRILFGFLKIVFLANYLVGRNFSGTLNGMDPSSWWYHYLDSLRYGLILYFKFAGYSDIAIGFSLLIGFRVMENFNYPFLAKDISDFWRRWHIPCPVGAGTMCTCRCLPLRAFLRLRLWRPCSYWAYGTRYRCVIYCGACGMVLALRYASNGNDPTRQKSSIAGCLERSGRLWQRF